MNRFQFNVSKNLDNLKYRFKNAGIVEQLIYINLAVFLLVFISNTFGFLFQSNSNFLVEWFALPANFDDFLSKPWTIITYGFLHTGFIHILANLFALFYIGNFFKHYFTSKQLLNFYLLGTVFGGVIFIASYHFFPGLQQGANNNILLGASAGISAIFIGSATYMPTYELRFPLIGYVKLWKLAAIWIALDVLQIPAGNAGGHLAHIGGALFGFLYVLKASNKEITIFNKLKKTATNCFEKKEEPLKTVYKSGKKPVTTSFKKSVNQQEVDAILDKISTSGYDTLTQTEKEFLFKQGTN
ncbi:rhomboid family intramembrane serine protease [Tenacibaculum finnmarkense]|uniref:Rhomboid family intramembrane serine protease n=1 Tax=Tenacibaculum finnmarkense genomovar finnmarkense TaxID=1458503 RepID=A0AAP1RG06_9FLAO|nr:rhomboid family intramembrane serine protease [Tenacibaculum finnmarkense]MBE7653071.1 rhomboid family intramembrane serine protease [Tenacibaculum finnmarkense genomovar finnmarkense]MBE7660680.1 rhomboid family intramembrane serine protease [Tenacibaculum finnmarkense genomovar finnmarkense]MBE7693347.1 rhomboid family intramembrane serine protease [Tenacibaculum finnmarkense genomovar finnmarkense]MBE7695372.1 rhomboid family intramembrane serine protease [Tenacibaculum finnmarkense genom